MRYCRSFFLALVFILLWNAPAYCTGKNQAVVESLSFHKNADGKEIVGIRLNGDSTPKIFMIHGDNPRIVLDFPDTRYASSVKPSENVDGKLATKIRVGYHKEQAAKTRVVIDLAPNGEYQYSHHFSHRDNTLLLTLSTKVEKNGKPTEKVGGILKKTVIAAETTHQNGAKKNLRAKSTQKTKEPSSGKVAVEPRQAPAERKPEAAESATEDSPSLLVTGTTQENPASPDLEPSKIEQPQDGDAAVTENTGNKGTGNAVQPQLLEVNFEKDAGKGEMVIFKLNGFFPPTVVGDEKGQPRVICDFSNLHLSKRVKDLLHCNGKYLESVKITKQNDKGAVRAVLALVPQRNYDLQQVFFKEDNLFVIIINSQENATDGKHL